MAVAALFFAASVALPALQGTLLVGAHKVLPFGLARLQAVSVVIGIAAGLVALFVVMCATYLMVPRGAVPWRAIRPGALLATAAIGIANWGFPVYLTGVSTIARLAPALPSF